jgi:tRNA(Ile)-lysidine synthase
MSHPSPPIESRPGAVVRAWNDPRWRTRWQGLTAAAGIAPDEPVTVALSGGADSVLMLHGLVAARAELRDSGRDLGLRAVHAHHGLREAADGDAAFCEELCAALELPLEVVHLELPPDGGNLEARARRARYTALLRAAREADHRVLVTGHHADDGLESLLMRWMRGSALAGLRGHRRQATLRGSYPGQPPTERLRPLTPVRLVRPLGTLRRAEVRRLMLDRELAWREDEHNRDPRFTRSRVRETVLPTVDTLMGPEGRERLMDFVNAVERLEDSLAEATAHLQWAPLRHARASRAAGLRDLGGELPRGELMRLPEALARRALWRLLTEGSGHSPGRTLLSQVLSDLRRGRTRRFSLPGGWQLALRSDRLELLPPRAALVGPQIVHAPESRGRAAAQLPLPFEELRPRALGGLQDQVLELRVPGSLRLPDGRLLRARVADAARFGSIPAESTAALLDARDLPPVLTVRGPRAGDRFHPFGGPGRRALKRFLADCGVPREERDQVPLVLAGDEILWVAGIRPAESRRIGPQTRRRLRLELIDDEGSASERDGGEGDGGEPGISEAG